MVELILLLSVRPLDLLAIRAGLVLVPLVPIRLLQMLVGLKLKWLAVAAVEAEAAPVVTVETVVLVEILLSKLLQDRLFLLLMVEAVEAQHLRILMEMGREELRP